MVMSRARAATSSTLCSGMAVETTTTSTPSRCLGSWPMRTSRPSSRSSKVSALSRTSLPLTRQPRACSKRATALTPMPPIPNK